MTEKNKDRPADANTKERRDTQQANLDMDRAFNQGKSDLEAPVDDKGAPRIPPD
jgi:hypothetical protein